MEIKIYPEQIVQGGLVIVRAGPYDPNEYDYRWEYPDFDTVIATPGDSDAERRIDTKGLQPGVYKLRISVTPRTAKTKQQRDRAIAEGHGEVEEFFLTIGPAPISAQQVEGMLNKAENIIDRLNENLAPKPLRSSDPPSRKESTAMGGEDGDESPPLVRVSLQRRLPDETGTDSNIGLWQAIRNRTNAVAFNKYHEFIDRVMCADDGLKDKDEKDQRKRQNSRRELIVSEFHGVDAYNLLRVATEAFLILEAGVFVKTPLDDNNYPLPENTVENDESSRLGRKVTFKDIKERLEAYLGGNRLPYLSRIVEALDDQQTNRYPDCIYVLENEFRTRLLFDEGLRHPLLLELIWSYWHEEGMLVQAINAISLRFQNRRGGAGRDPLANLEIDPLRPLNNVLWGYIQDEYRRLTVNRRAYEYGHEYGLSLYGKAVPDVRLADSRSKFLEAYHNLLYMATVFFKQADDTTVNADPFPLLNALREVHLILAQGAHNQFGDLPWTARAEMLTQQWLLARREMSDFLRGRIMVPYEEAWMGQVETMKTLQGWTDTSISHFHRLARFGEQLLLSIRYTDWIGINISEPARDWALYWRPEIQTYIHSYRAVTGVDLAAEASATQPLEMRYKLPSELLRQRLTESRNGRDGRVSSLPPVVPAPAGFRERKAQRK